MDGEGAYGDSSFNQPPPALLNDGDDEIESESEDDMMGSTGRMDERSRGDVRNGDSENASITNSFKKIIGGIEEKTTAQNDKDIATRLKAKLSRDLPAFDMVIEFWRYVELIEQPNMFGILRGCRERLIIGLIEAIEVYRKQMDNSEFPANIYTDTTAVMDKMYHLKHMKMQMVRVSRLTKRILHDLPNVNHLEGKLNYVLEEIDKEEKVICKEWCDGITKSIRRRELSLKENEQVIEFGDGSRQMQVTYNPELARVSDETQQLLILGYHIPRDIVELAAESKKFVRQARELDQIATFHNTIGDRMIPSQRPMMLDTAVALSRMVQEQDGVVWSKISEVDYYITGLKKNVENLAKQNAHLSSVHITIKNKLAILFETDLIKYQVKWKDVLLDIRGVFKDVERQGYKNMKSWMNHWDRQVYKVLEVKYLACLNSLNENLPDISVDMVYRQERLQFRPSMEELRMTYYVNVRKFINIPLNFRGIMEENSDETIFSTIIKRHAYRFEKVYREAEVVFSKMTKSQEKFLEWIALGSANIASMSQELLRTADDWDKNFRISKAKGQEIVRMNCVDEKFGCFIVSYKLLRLEIELVNRKYWEILVTLLNNSIYDEMGTLESFLNEGINKLREDPQSVDQISKANLMKEQLSAKLTSMKDMLQSLDNKNKILGTWTKERFDLTRITSLWDQFNHLLDNHQHLIGRQVENLKINLKGQVRSINNEMENFKLRWEQLKPKDNEITRNPLKFDQAIQYIAQMRAEWNALMERKVTVAESCSNLSVENADFPFASEVEENLANYEKSWSKLAEYRNGFKEFETEDWIIFRAKPYRFEEYLQEWDAKFRNEPKSEFIVPILRDIEENQTIIPNLRYIRGDIFTDKHWYEMFRLLGMPNKHLGELKLGDFLAVRDKINDNIKDLKELNTRASGEVIVTQALNELDSWDIEARFQLSENKDSQNRTIYIIQDFKSVLNKLGDNQSLLQSIRTSPFYSHFADRITMWESKLADLDDYIQSLNKIQRRWIYLEPIFSHGVLESEQQRFRRIDEEFRNIMAKINVDARVSNLCKQSGIRNRLDMLLDQLSRCQNSLNEFLEKKRSGFPRFYFLGDDDLLEILGQSTKPSVIQAHLRKLFAGIYSVDFDNDFQQIIAMKSLEGETVLLKSSVKVTSNVEEWLSELSNEMKYTLKSLLLDCVSDSKHDSMNPAKYPTQILCLSNSIVFTDQCEEAIRSGRLQGLLTQLKQDLEKYTNIRIEQDNPGAKVMELKLKDLILDIIHHIDITEYLVQKRIRTVTDWHWQKQLRFYIRDDGMATIRMADAEFTYSYEYQGNAQKLVHTSLTDKCYLTLTQGMRMGLGGNPYGPAGTGKTESVKALGTLMGRQVLVFNCDEGIDVKSMGRIFMGLVKCGAWGCFDEFNRLEGATLSAVSMQIQPIQTALKQGSPNVVLMDELVSLDPNSGIFVTLNPAGHGYGGRNKLPDNLKQLFRPVVMSQPDNERIAEVILYTEGYKHAKKIGRKLVEVFKLSEKLLTRQNHYDWGLRALKTVLKGCGSSLKEFKKGQGTVSEKEESDIVVSTLRLNTLPKLTYSDCFRFDNLIKDVFPNATFKALGYHDLGESVRAVCKEFLFEVNENQVRKCLELYEQLQQRMGVVIVGPPCCGKSTILSMLKQALLRMGEKVKTHVMNPKAMPRTHLLGHINLDTRQWTDGILTMKAQQVYSEPSDVTSWIICDGDIDPEWIESLNSVLDDNRLLTLPSGWRIKFGPNVNFIFETHDLSLASPATISRMGMIFMSEEDADIKGIVSSWLRMQPEETRATIQQLIDDYFYKGLEWILHTSDQMVQLSAVSVAQNALSLMPGVKSVGHMAVNLIRGLGGHLSPENLMKFSEQVLEWTQQSSSIGEDRLNLCYNRRTDRVEPYQDDPMDPEEEFQFTNLPLVKTADVKRILDHISPWLENQQSFILIGPEGCGKTMLLEYAFRELRSTEVAVIHCSSLISPDNVIQKLSQICITMSTKTGRVYKSKDGERLILYFKDLNLVKPDKWGTCQLVEFLRQIIVHNGFYDKNLEWVMVQGIQIVASITIGNTCGRYNLSPRFTARIGVCTMNQPESNQLFTICHSYVGSLLATNFPSHPIHKSSNQVDTLASGMVSVYNGVRAAFSPVSHSHYQFTPRDLTRWALGLMRYEIAIEGEDGMKDLYCAWAYESCRLFRDKLVSIQDKITFDDTILLPVVTQWGFTDTKILLGIVWISSFANTVVSPGLRLLASPLLGPSLQKVSMQDLSTIVEKGIVAFGRENRDLNVVIIPEVLENVAYFDRILSFPCSSMVLAGRAGVGRRTALSIVSALHQATIVTLKVGRNYSVKLFKNDLKAAIQISAIEGNKVFLVIEDYQLVDVVFLDMINSLLSSGEIPGLYSADELEIIISSLRDIASSEGYTSSLYSYFALRVKRMMQVVLILDFTNETFIKNCQSNPALYKKCSMLWLDVWSDKTLKIMPLMIIKKYYGKEGGDFCGFCSVFSDANKKQVFQSGFQTIYRSMNSKMAYPRRYVTLIHNHATLYLERHNKITQQMDKLTTGLSKLEEAKSVVENLKSQAWEQEKILAEKQAEANKALEMITTTMHNSNIQRGEMEQLRQKSLRENEILEQKKKAIDAEMAEIQPTIELARSSVGNIKNEAISEIRSLRAPPDVIRDILEGVLRLMGIRDMSWNSMKSFLSKRGVKDEIRNFDADTITAADRDAVEHILKMKQESFEPKNAKRASAAAAPLAEWVVANVKYSKVLEKVEPLQKQQKILRQNLKVSEDHMEEISSELVSVDERVQQLKGRFNQYTKEAAETEFHLSKAKTTLSAAEGLVGKLNDEFTRWNVKLHELDEELNELPLNSLMAAAFITYLSDAPEDVRSKYLNQWSQVLKRESFDFCKLLSTERDLLQWQSLELPPDRLSQENAIMILQTCLRPFLVDPSGAASYWLIKHLSTIREPVLVALHDPKFTNELELAVRFGKILVVLEADVIEPILIPILRGDLVSQGSRDVVPIAEKMVDYNPSFRLFLCTRNPHPHIPPDAAAVLTVVNFTTTRAGLTSQLLSKTLSLEKPEIETRKTELVKNIDSLKMQLEELGESLLQGLASSQGNILENLELLDSLNKTKASSLAIASSLLESSSVEASLNKEIEVYRPFSEFGSQLYFGIVEVAKLNPMYQFSLTSFIGLFKRTLLYQQQNATSVDQRIEILGAGLLETVYEHVCRALFKVDRMAFAMHLAHLMNPREFQKDEWEAFSGLLVVDLKPETSSSVPAWVREDRRFPVEVIMSTFPDLYENLELANEELWKEFYHSSECEDAIPMKVKAKISKFQEVLILHALRPDRLQTSMYNFARKIFAKKTLFPPPPSLRQILKESRADEPILMMVSSGADPSQEVRELVEATIGLNKYVEISMGQGQVDIAIQKLRQAKQVGHWICMKNLHLVTHLLDKLEKEIRSHPPHENFRLWLTTEPHSAFTNVLAHTCVKLAYEAPQGVKKNLQRTFESWPPEYVVGDRNIMRSQCLFVLAVFHAIVQERRTYIPQGWSTPYEFNDSDLRAGADVIEQLFKGSRSKEIQWSYIHGLFENAIYGGRVDNDYDNRVLVSYLTDYFNESILTGGNPSKKTFGPNVVVPTTTNIQEYLKIIEAIPENDKPSFFGLPSNIEKSWQRTTSQQVIGQLKYLTREFSDTVVFDRNLWSNELTALLNLWKKLHHANNSLGLLQEKLIAPGLSEQEHAADPIECFVYLEYHHIVSFMQTVHKTLGGFSKVIRGLIVPPEELTLTANTLMKREIPSEWLTIWEGPQDAVLYLQGLVGRAAAVKKWMQRLKSGDLLKHPIDLSDVLNPDTFLTAFKQYCARKIGVSMDALKFVCAWDRKTISSSMTSCQLTGLLLEGCSFNGVRLLKIESEDLPVNRIVDCTIAWLPPNEDIPQRGVTMSVPLYANEMRKKLIGSLEVPTDGDESKWIKTGVAVFLRT